ncbi:MAG: hypothetical protein DRP93_04575, partial [Candidatus Neomarinimicrobiota bacterium]
MIASKNYRLIETLLGMTNILYNDVVVKNADKFKIESGIKETFLELREEIFTKTLDKKMGVLNIPTDAKHLNLPFRDFYAKSDVLKHKVLTYPRTLITVDDLYANYSDNKILLDLKSELQGIVHDVTFIINPTVKNILNDMEKYVKDTELELLRDGYNLTYIDIPEFAQTLKDEGGLLLDESYNKPFNIDFSAGDVNDFLPTSDQSEFVEYLSKFSSNKISDTYSKYLSNPNSMSDAWLELINVNNYENYDDLFITFILAYNMSDARINERTTLVEHNAVIMTILNLLKNKIGTRLDHINVAYQRSMPILSVNGKEVYLLKNILSKGVQQGISMDTIFGALYKGKSRYTIDDLVVNNDYLTKSWNDYIEQKKVVVARSNANNTLRTYIKTIETHVMSSDLTIDKDRLLEVLKLVDHTDLNNLEENTTKLVLT